MSKEESNVEIVAVANDFKCLQRGSITIITKRFDEAHSTVYQLWECAACMHATGDIISLEINSWEKIVGGMLYTQQRSSRRASRISHCGRGILKENLQH